MPDWNSGTAHVFWYTMDEHLEIVGPHGFRELFVEHVYIIFKFWVCDFTESVNQGKKKSLETFNQGIISWWNQHVRGMPMQSN